MSAGELSPRDALWRMKNSYQVSQAINAAATLGIADLLVDGPKSPDELAKATGGRTRPPSTGCCERWPAWACSPSGTTAVSSRRGSSRR
jgi:hypothetical protein